MDLDERGVKGSNTRIIVFHTIHGPRPEAEDQTQHARLRIHALLTDESVVGEPHPGDFREEVVLPAGARNPLDQQRQMEEKNPPLKSAIIS
jgi:hypothetical protein